MESSLAASIRELARDLENLSYEADSGEVDSLDESSAGTILNLLKVLPRVTDHLEGFGSVTDRDLRILKEETAGLQRMANTYGVKEPVTAGVANG